MLIVGYSKISFSLDVNIFFVFVDFVEFFLCIINEKKSLKMKDYEGNLIG